MRTNHAAAWIMHRKNLAVLRHMALNLLRRETER
jgi:hypothetical protein